MKFWLKVSVLYLAGLCLFAQTVSTGDQMHARLRGIGEKLKCFCGAGGSTCSYTVGSCNMLQCPFREEVNAQIRPMLEAGMKEESILGKLKERYGIQILAAPPAEGFNLVGWVMPFVALVMGLIAVRYLLVRWRRPRPAPVPASPLVERFRDQMEKELADLE